MLYQATHTTRYTYPQPVSTCLSEARLMPRELPWQHVKQWDLSVDPRPSSLSGRTDYFGNQVSTFSVTEPHYRLTVTAQSIVEVQAREAGFEFSPRWEDARETLALHSSAATMEAFEFTCDSPFVTRNAGLAAYARPAFWPERPLFEAAADLMRSIHIDFLYVPKSTTIETPLDEVMKGRQGVCQDFSHVMIGALRSLGLAARYVSGYLRSGAQYQGAETSHAWVAVFIPGAGWVPFDPTNDVVPSDGHVTLAWGRDFGDVTPLKGVTLGGGGEGIEVEVRVDPVER